MLQSTRCATPTTPHAVSATRAARIVPRAFFSRLGSVLSALRPSQAGMALATEKWWDANTVAVVTGSNKGIGFEAARMLAEQGLTVVLTSRDIEQGKAAVAKIKEAAPGARVLLRQLDLANAASVDSFATWLEQETGGLTILINNAGFAYKGNIFGADEAQTTININFAGTRHLTEKLVPLLQGPCPRIINVSSRAGLRSIVKDKELLGRLTAATSPDQLAAMADEFVAGIRDGTYGKQGWPGSMYGTSKLLVSLWTAQLAAQLQGRHVMVNAMCPGWCRTDMSSQRGTKSAAEGADTAVWLALRSPKDFVTGGFWGERSSISW